MDYTALGNRVRAARRKRYLTQEKLAEETGLTAAFLGHIERGTRKASLETIVSLANALAVSVDDLLQDSLNETLRRRHLNEARQDAAVEEILGAIRKNARYFLSEESYSG